MTRAAGTSVENNFVKGLVSEATGMNFPENAASETYDCVFHPIGAVTRRQGFDTETNGVFQSITTDVSAVAEFEWRNVANIGNLTFVVQQVGLTLYFFEVSQGALSPGKKTSTISLSTYSVPGSSTTGNGVVAQFSSGDGRLFVTHPSCEPFYCSYDLAGDTITATQINITIRDFKRQADGLAVDSRPSSLTDLHKYNLYNQGWYYNNSLGYWDSNRADWPSNADIWWLFKNASEVIDAGNFDKVYRGNSAAPGGHYIINPFNTDRQTQSGISGVVEDTAGTARPAANAFYAGRLWVGGTAAVGYGDVIYFSQIIEDPSQYGKCYSMNDPTSESNSDLLPSDGGTVRVPGMGQLIRLYALGSTLIVLASNGVWTIGGSSGSGFFATDYTVQKVSEHQCVGPMSVVEVEGVLLWWNYVGIYMLQLQAGGIASVQSATDTTIKTFYKAIPQNNIPYVKGAYNPQEMLVQWLYRSTVAPNIEDNFRYDRFMNLRTNTQAFYPWTISTTTPVGAPAISGIVCIHSTGLARNDVTVSSNGQTVILA